MCRRMRFISSAAADRHGDHGVQNRHVPAHAFYFLGSS